MENFINWITTANSNWITILTIFAAWLIFRLGVSLERKSILDGLVKELDLHKNWMGNQYPDQIVPIGSSWNQLNYVVFQLSTVAIDNAIARGPHLFLNRQLMTELIGYRQMVNQFNQLIEVQQTFQANIELWDRSQARVNRLVRNRMLDLTGQIHWYGISDSSKLFGYTYFQAVNKELIEENKSKIAPIIWAVTNINLFWFKKLLKYF